MEAIHWPDQTWLRVKTCESARHHVPSGFYFNPFAFARPVVRPSEPIPSSGGRATAAAIGTDIGNVSRNCLRGPRQVNLDLALAKRFPISMTRAVEFRAELFNLFNQANFANPISNVNAAPGTGGRIDSNTGEPIAPGNFDLIISTSSNPRIAQIVLKLVF